MKKLMIKSIDSYNEKNFEIVHGAVRENGEWLIYEYSSKLGECTLMFSSRRVLISRKGEIETFIDVDLDKRTEFNYKTKELNKIFNIQGEEIVKDSKKGILQFSYKILDGELEINRITIAVKDY